MEKILQVGVKALIKDLDGKYLIVKRSEEKYKGRGGGEWDIPGGRIEIGSSLNDNLAREIFEETKIKYDSEPKLLTAQDIFLDDRHVVRLVYSLDIDDRNIEVALDTEENTDYKWVTLAELKDIRDLDKKIGVIIDRL